MTSDVFMSLMETPVLTLGMLKSRLKDLRVDRGSRQTCRDRNLSEFALSFESFTAQQFELTALHVSNTYVYATYEPYQGPFLHDIVYRLDKDPKLLLQEVSSWIQQGYTPTTLFYTNKVWFASAARHEASQHSFTLLHAGDLSAFLTQLHYQASHGWAPCLTVSDGKQWFCILERLPYTFQWFWLSFPDQNQLTQACKRRPDVSWTPPIYANDHFFIFGTQRLH